MGSKAWINWLLLAVGVTAAWAVVFTAINAVESSLWFAAARANVAITVLSLIVVMALVNVGMLTGFCLCRAASGRRVKTVQA